MELGDLEQAGYLGLHDAWHRFDNRVCDDFRPYAKQRIRGSIHDWLRREDLLSRGARADVRKVQTTADQFRTRYGFEPEEEVLGRLTGLRPDRVFHVQTWSTRGAAVAVSVIAANEPEPEGCLPPAESCSEARSELLDWLECTFDVRTRTMVALYHGESHASCTCVTSSPATWLALTTTSTIRPPKPPPPRLPDWASAGVINMAMAF